MHSAYKKQLLKLTYVNKEKKHIKSILTWMNQQQFNHLKFFGILFAPHLFFGQTLQVWMIGPDIWQWWRREIISFYEPVSFWQSIKHIAWLMFWDFLHFQGRDNIHRCSDHVGLHESAFRKLTLDFN